LELSPRVTATRGGMSSVLPPTARAARQLRDAAGVDADTIHALLLHLTRSGRLSQRTVLVIDEAGMAPTRLTARLFKLAETAGAKMIAVGDPGQLGAVEAGGWLAAITVSHTQPALASAIRQHDPAERDAVAALRDGDPDPYLEHDHNHIATHEDEVHAIQSLVGQWQAARARHGARGAVMIARDNYTRELANRAARTHLKHAGELSGPTLIAGGREYAAGDRVIARRNQRHHDIDNGTLGTIAAIDHSAGASSSRPTPATRP
jgi:ATP-dependent exoDNAse (exonuclease V) alpha subunit